MTRKRTLSTAFVLTLAAIALAGPIYIVIDVLTGINDDPAAQAVARIGGPIMPSANAANGPNQELDTLQAGQ